MSSTELLEANVIFIRSDLAELRTEVRTVAARLDQDIRELRTDNKTLRDKIDATHAALDKKIDVTAGELRADMARMRTETHANFNEVRTSIEDLRTGIADLCISIGDLRISIGDLKAMQKAILWVLGGIGTVAAIAGVGLTIAKTLQWI